MPLPIPMPTAARSGNGAMHGRQRRVSFGVSVGVGVSVSVGVSAGVKRGREREGEGESEGEPLPIAPLLIARGRAALSCTARCGCRRSGAASAAYSVKGSAGRHEYQPWGSRGHHRNAVGDVQSEAEKRERTLFERDRAPWLWGFPHHQSPLAGWYPTRARRIFV